jgi:hypothetical protein
VDPASRPAGRVAGGRPGHRRPDHPPHLLPRPGAQPAGLGPAPGGWVQLEPRTRRARIRHAHRAVVRPRGGARPRAGGAGRRGRPAGDPQPASRLVQPRATEPRSSPC